MGAMEETEEQRKAREAREAKEQQEAALARLMARQHGLVTRQQARKLKFSTAAIRWRLEHRQWCRAQTGVYRLVGVGETPEQAILAACLAVGGVASHRAAAHLLDLPNIPYALELTVSKHSRGVIEGLTTHRALPLEREDKNWVKGVPTTSVSRTVIDLAGVLSRKELEALVDHVLATRRVKLKFLMERLDDLGTRGRQGAKALREVLQARVGKVVVNSEPQRELARLLKDFGLPPGIPEYEIRLRDGRHRRVDNGWPEVLFGVQMDSYRHHSTLADHTSDIVRDADAVAEGWRILRVTPEQLNNEPRKVAQRIARALGVELQARAGACL